jgi:hypothetical protein
VTAIWPRIWSRPPSLGWDGDRIAEFASGVEVLGNAEAAAG